ncbi:MAG: type II toxin-antitoxin system RelE/ParE family toxin [Smithella sp.]
MYKLSYSPEALNDLDEIFAYIQNELQNPAAAQGTVSDIFDTIEKLRDFPEIGSLLSSITGFESDYRHLICGNYIIFYRTNNANVFIDRILYGRRDYLRILFNGTSEE